MKQTTKQQTKKELLPTSEYIKMCIMGTMVTFVGNTIMKLFLDIPTGYSILFVFTPIICLTLIKLMIHEENTFGRLFYLLNSILFCIGMLFYFLKEVNKWVI